MSADASPNVRVFPPLVYAVALLVGLAFSHWLPTPVVDPAVAHVVGAVPAVAGAALAAIAVGLFRRAGTTVRPNGPTNALVVSGPYRFTRNPMYVAFALLYLGVALAAQSLWARLLLPAVLAVIRARVIAPEEAFLRRRFGDAYIAYQARVRRWL